MKKIKLTQGKFALVDDKDFDWLSQWKWYINSNGYAARKQWLGNKKERVIFMHRFINGTPPKGYETDHSNGQKLDNRRVNLRMATRGENMANNKLHKNNTSGYRGVYRTSNQKWSAQINFNNIQKYLGIFSNKQDAARAYDKEARRLFGDFASPNFID